VRERGPVIRQLGERRWGRVAQATIVGLYLSRILAESSGGPWRLLHVLPLALASILVCLALLAPFRARSLQTWPLYLLFGYVLWPQPNSTLSLAFLFVVFVVFLMLNAPGKGRDLWVGAAVFVAALVLYISTLAPTILPADSGEFQLVANVLGIAHPPGYPLYTLLGKLFSLLPIGDRAYRVNLFGAVCGALSLSVVAGSVHRVTGSTVASLLAAAMLGLCATFWAQSTTANIRSLTALLTALCLAFLVRWGETRSRRHLVAFGACFGLGVGHHPSIALLGLPFLAYVLTVNPGVVLKPRRWGPSLAAFATSLLVLLYLPIRSLMGVPGITSWTGFVNYVLALGFRGDVLRFHTVAEMAARGRVWLNIMRLQFGPVLPWVTLLAIWPLVRRNWRVLVLLLGTWAVNTLSALTYRAPQTVEYLIPSYVALALLLGQGVGLALRFRLPHPARVIGAALLLTCAVSNGLANYPSFRILHRDTSTRDYAGAILRDAPADALVLANWHHATALWFLQQVEGLRPDVEVTYVYPEGVLPNEEVWLRRIGEQASEHSIIVTNWFHAFEQTEYRWVPFHDAWLVRQKPAMDLSEEIVSVDAWFENGIHLLGYQLEQGELVPGDKVKLRVCWRPTTRPQSNYSSFVQVLGPAGVVGQDDIAHRATQFLPGEIRVDLYTLPLLLHTPPGEYQIITGFYLGADEGGRRLLVGGSDYLTLTGIHVHPGGDPVATLHPMDNRFANGLRLTGADFDRSLPGQTRLYLHWQCPKGMPLEMGPRRVPLTEPAIIRLMNGKEFVAQAGVPKLQPGSAATVALDLPDGLASVSLSMVRPNGEPVARLGPWHRRVSADLDLPLPEGKVHYIPLGGEMIFTGFSGLSEATKPGDEMWLRPRFLCLRPLIADYSVSVGLSRCDLAWEQKADGTPALGAIPTLKWLRSWLVEDPHPLSLEADAPPGLAVTTLTVYDAFTLEPLHVLDERLVREGQGVHLELERVRIR